MPGVQFAHLLVVLLLAGVALAWFARRVRLPYPIALVLGGTLLGFAPLLPQLQLDPALILTVALPPVLYWAAVLTSWRDFRANARAIGLLAVGLVIATTVAIAAVAHWLWPELGWPAAFALGAILSPPDAVAATAVLGQLRMPRRIVTILEGESLMNDATGLVLYQFAVAAALTGSFSMAGGTLKFLWVAAAGVAIGVAVAFAFTAVHKRLHDAMMEIVCSLALPYTAYMLAEYVHVSGVLAVVAAGLVRARYSPEVFSAHTRMISVPTWNVVVFLVNCLIFILIGLQLPRVMSQLELHYPLWQLVGAGLLLTAVAIAVRMAWVFPGSYLPRWLWRKLGRHEDDPPWQHVVVVGWCGMRGIVSIAAALAIPVAAADGTAFPGRDLLIFLTFVVVLATLLLPGLTLAPLVRALKVRGDWSHFAEQRLAREHTARAALTAVELLAAQGDLPDDVAAHLRAEYGGRLARSQTHGMVLAAGADPLQRGHAAALSAARAALLELWRAQRISDEVMHEVERELDLQEARHVD